MLDCLDELRSLASEIEGLVIIVRFSAEDERCGATGRHFAAAKDEKRRRLKQTISRVAAKF